MSDAPTSTSRGRGRGGSRGRGSSRGRSAAAPQALPTGSVSKIKAQLRQTKRLLAKEDLNPDVRVTSERRLAALEDELVKAEKGLLEKKMVTKYRGIKFFERQKVLRRIKQAKRQVENDADSQQAKQQLRDARLDLHYILRYPKTEKYLALYPENTYIPYSPTPPATSTTTSGAITPSDPSTSKVSKSKANNKALEGERKRWELRTIVLEKVDSGVWDEVAEGGDLAIEGEEDATEDIGVGEKRARVDQEELEQEEQQERGKATVVEQEDDTPAKKRKLDESAIPETTTEATEETPATVAEADGEAAGEPKKLNRKQKKALRRAQEAAGEVPPADKATVAPVQTSNQKGAAVKPQQTVKKGGKKAVEVPQGKKTESSKAEKLAMEDDFFA
ncbi:Efg1p [Sporobolomyces koalae]|uniref:Efg1p n=1 Tax=Sporobolomyces koalae TaxID=500713 RepID=UPI0031788413